MKMFARWFALLAFVSLAAFAQNNGSLPPNYLSTAHVMHVNHAGGLHGKGNIPTPHGFPQGVDTLVNFTDHFEAQGVFYDGSAHHTWEYSMMGNAPQLG
ncbi:MAG TPA: hypothetical protein VE866_03260, partial [Candidatus Binatia bacterium]|nr:hypothetical protein [Candidatus Binatia bacterium]